MRSHARQTAAAAAPLLALAIALNPMGSVAVAADAAGQASLPQRLQSYLADLAAKDAFSGVVVLAKDGTKQFSGAYGMASKEYGVPNTLETRFNLGSINKLTTQIAILQLAEHDKLALTDTVAKLLPDYPNKEVARRVTVRDLLNMVSGIGDFFGPEYEATPKDKIRSLHDYLPLFASKPLLFAPGTQHRYSNGGYIVLGLIVERLSGQAYYDYVRANIFAPAGMNASGWFERDVPTPNVATGYTRRSNDPAAGSVWRNNIYTAPARGSSAGGGNATAADLLKLAAAIQTGSLLSATDAAKFKGGLGVAGGAPGINADLEIDPRSGYVLVVLSNYDPPAAEDVARTIRGWLGFE